MSAYSQKSKEKLATCHPDLQKIFNEVIKHYDCAILTGHRNEEDQNDAYNAAPQRSKVKWPNSRHNTIPSEAVDVVPYPIDWDDRERFSHFAGFVLGISISMGIDLRWGGDWDSDTDLKDNNFDDLPHFELRR